MNVKRNIPPQAHDIDRVEYIEPDRNLLKNGVELFVLKSGDLEVAKIDFSFKAGAWYAKSKLVNTMAASMLQEGTIGHKAIEIANTFDFYGAQFSSLSSFDNSYISLLSLKKHLPFLLPLVSEIIREASFPEEEFEILRHKKKQRAIVDSGKVSLVAQRGFLRNLFGEQHPYSPVINPDHYDTIRCEDAKSHHANFYRPDLMTIFASGLIDEGAIGLIEDHFSYNWGHPLSIGQTKTYGPSVTEKSVFIEKPGANQNAVAIGKVFPTQNHPDFPGLRLLCTILGGYFGSRLMTNLREEKGYTYSIQASPVTFKQHGAFLVFAEVKTDKTDETVKEIFGEMDRLCNELITEDELKPVQNYMLGRILEDFDGPFARAHTFASLREAGLDFDYCQRLITSIKTTAPIEIRELAQKYLSPETMCTVIAGTR